MKLRRREVKRGRIEIIPMIDTILILLIFYMTFSTFRAPERALAATLPARGSAGTGPATAPPPEIVLHVFSRDRIVLNGHTTLDLDTVAGVLAQAVASGLDARVVIEAERTTRYDHVVSTLDACAIAGVTKVGLTALPEPVPETAVP